MTLAAIRPGAWDLALFVHIAGAMLLVAALVVVAAAMGGALRRADGADVLTRLALRGLLLGVLPAYVLMRAGAEWIASKEGLADSDAAWIGVGYATADGGLLLSIIATIVAWRATRRGDAGPGGLGRAVVVLAGLLLVAYAVTIWAMTTKPA
jgi:hypothetical protein